MEVEVVQLEGRRFAIRARGNEVIVDDTIEAGGPGDGFRPSELLVGGLGACMMGTMVTFARNQEIDLSSVRFSMSWEYEKHPERIGRITADISYDSDADERHERALRRVAKACTIHNTLERSPELESTFAD